MFNPGLSLAFLNRRERLTAKAVVSRRLAKLTPFYHSTFLIIYFEPFYKFSSFLQPNYMDNMDNGMWSR